MSHHHPPGKFIALEGGEGTGKSTQARLLAATLEARGIHCTVTREPGGTPGAEAIRSLLLGSEVPWSIAAEALLFAAARSDHVTRLIRPALAAGQWVICDRFIDSSRAYQGEAGRLGTPAVETLHAIGSGGLMPDLAVLLRVSPEISAARLELRDGATSDRIGGRGAAYHAQVAAAFERFAAAEPQRFAVVDGEGEPDAVAARILAVLVPVLSPTLAR